MRSFVDLNCLGCKMTKDQESQSHHKSKLADFRFLAEDGDCSSAIDRQMLLVEMIVDLATGMGHMWNVGIARRTRIGSQSTGGQAPHFSPVTAVVGRQSCSSLCFLTMNDMTVAVDRRVVASFLACDYRRGQAGVMLGRRLPVDRHAGGRFFDD
eukprot:scaffold2637_cov46-Cyclotella_meneghiniana.AAC.6